MWGQPPSAVPLVISAQNKSALKGLLLLLLSGSFFLICGAERSLRFCDRQQRGIELDECGIYRRVFRVTAIATRSGWNHLRGLALIESEERPLARETRFVFHVYFEAHDFRALEIPFLID